MAVTYVHDMVHEM